jgi:multiple sugar transport system substrate-binding protein
MARFPSGSEGVRPGPRIQAAGRPGRVARRHAAWASLVAAVALLVAGCGAVTSPDPGDAAPTSPAGGSVSLDPTATPAPSLDTTPVTLTVWDYYGAADTPFTDHAIAAFEQEYPWITVDRRDIDGATFLGRFVADVASGHGPDVATLDTAWMSDLAPTGALLDLSAASGGLLNGRPIADQYAAGPLSAMTYGGRIVTMMSDIDAYVLFYRADLLAAKGIEVPRSWDDLRLAARELAEDADGDGSPDRYLYAVRPDTPHFAQFLFQNGGRLLDEQGTKSSFNSDAGVGALDYQAGLLGDGTALALPDGDAALLPAVVDGRVAMFAGGPSALSLLRSGAPHQAGDWRVAIAPYKEQTGSYLGGTGLSIPAAAAHPRAAWLFIEHFLRPEQQVRLYTVAGLAPATTAALESPELTRADPYFGGEAPFAVFRDAMTTATPLPYVSGWDRVQTILDDALSTALRGRTDSRAALDEAAIAADEILAR